MDESRRNRFAALTAVLVAGAATAALSGCAQEADSAAASTFQTAVAERNTIVSSVVATGTIEPIKIIDVKSQASGEILEMPVELGDAVSRGDLLVRIDPRDVRNAYEQAQADLEVAQAREEVTGRRLERARMLRDSSVVTDEELETAILNHADAKAALVRAETNLRLARDRLEDVTVRAPIAGTIVEKNVEEGQIVTSTREVTGGTTIVRMADLAQVQVRTLVDEIDIGRIQPGMPATITVEAYPDRTFRGEVLKIEPQAVVQQNVTMFAVLTRIANEEDLLRPGMNADVEIVIGRRPDVLALPNAAIKTPDEARQLVNALGMDRDLLQQRVEVPEADRTADGRAGGEGSAGGAADDSEGELPSPGELRSMSREERRELVQSLDAAQRRQLFQRMRELRAAREAADRADPARPKPAFVFKQAADGLLTLKPIRIGLSSYEQTEVIAGLEDGEQVLEVPLSLVQQQELLQRIRERSGVPGVSRN